MSTNRITIDNPTFDSVAIAGEKTGGVYLHLHNSESVKCECWKDHKKAAIAFDLYTRSCNHDLAPEAQERLYNEHKAYIQSAFANAGYSGPIHCTFSATIIHFNVLPQDAETWFQKILTTLNNRSDMIESTPKRT
jgi:hypothetical protein